jgi:HAD superfamily hydrolase (TIGR01509 family)
MTDSATRPRVDASPLVLVIFDCDGVLVDSERLAVRTEVEVLAELGWPLEEREVIERFVGRSPVYMQAAIERQLGRPIDFDRLFMQRHEEVFERELRVVDGIVALLDALEVPICVASSGTHERIRRSLELVGLADRFEGRVFSASDVARGKPAPDLFFHAAATMGVAPARCAVVEDSVPGVEAGCAAGMSVFAFGGGVTDPAALARPGVTVVESMHELIALLAPWGAQRPGAGTSTSTLAVSRRTPGGIEGSW